MMTITLLMAGTALAAAMGIYEAYSKQRGFFGWLISIAASIAGAIAAGMTLPMLIITVLNPTSRDVAGYVGLASVLVGVLAGSAIALWIVNRFR